MATIFYGVSGEGRGHATRARTVVEALREEHDIVLYAPDLAYALLRPLYEGTNVEVRSLPGIPHRYTATHRFDLPGTGLSALRYFAGFSDLLRRLQQAIEREAPALVLTDFEPTLPRAARRCGVPFVSLTHQHVLLVSDFDTLPPHLRCFAALIGQVVRAYYRGPVETIVSSFYFPPLKPAWQHVTQVGVLLRPEIVHAVPETGRHVVAYLRRFASPAVLQALADSRRDVRIYGLGAWPSRGRLSFYDIDPYRFAEDLATGRALVSTAGNQLIGEALYLGKPVLALPESGNHEQLINAHFLEQVNAGMGIPMNAATPPHVHTFLDRVDTFRACIDRDRVHGNAAALAAIRRHLPAPAPALPHAEALVADVAL